MKQAWRIAAAVALAAGMAGTALAAGSSEHWLGGGAHYWVTVDDVELDNVDENGVGWFATYRWTPSTVLGLELVVEALPDDFAGADDTVYAPQGYLLLGTTLYAGAGIGYYYVDSELSDDPFYALKAGLNVEILPRVALDVSADYRFIEWDSNLTDDIGSDTVTLSAALRLGL